MIIIRERTLRVTIIGVKALIVFLAIYMFNSFRPTPTFSFLKRLEQNVIKAHHLVPPCLVSQQGNDGFGHQLEGKLSLMMLGQLFPSQFKYVHIPFKSFQHISLTGEYMNRYMGFDKIFDQWEAYDEYKLERIPNMRKFITEGWKNCSRDTIYWADNAWVTTLYNMTLKSRVNRILRHSTFFYRLRHVFYKQIYDEVNYKSIRFTNRAKAIVIHIRRGDGMWRAMTTEYFDKAIEYYQWLYGDDLYYYIESDDPNWEYIEKTLPERLGKDRVFIGRENDVLVTLCRMILAQGLIASDSSLDRAAIMYRPDPDPVVVPDNMYFQMLDNYVHVECKTNCSVRTIWYPE